VSLVALLRDSVARIVAARESLDLGDTSEASQILYELELDIVRVRLDDFNAIPDKAAA